MDNEKIMETYSKYNKDNVSIATLGSHSALNILDGARREGFKTVLICKKGRDRAYKFFNVADEIIYVNSFKEVLNQDVVDKLHKLNAILIPHGSLVAYAGAENLPKFNVPLLGNRTLLKWESQRELQRKWLKESKLRVPRQLKPEKIKDIVMVKFPGARGGRGYFLCRSTEEYNQHLEDLLKKGKITKEDMTSTEIQEYIIGANIYFQYFYSPINNEVELLSIDKRYETNVDNLARVPKAIDVDPSFVIVGNIPVVIRESLLDEVFEMGDKLVNTAKKLVNQDMVGPFCLETVCTDKLEFYTFEISSRIVAGSNPFIPSSPYTAIKYNEEMSTGRRIARELKTAIKNKQEHKILT